MPASQEGARSGTSAAPEGDSRGRQRGGLPWHKALLKRSFDIAASFFGLCVLGWLMLIAAAIATLDTGKNGFFSQKRIGRFGRPFRLLKVRTMRDMPQVTTTVTTPSDPRITRFGALLRRTKIDELPQLVNVLLGQMSFVGPRPDVPGFADTLEGEQRLILSVRPGITGPATLKYRDEERLLAGVDDPESYNREVVYPDKVRLNVDYVRNYRFVDDLKYIWQTVIG